MIVLCRRDFRDTAAILIPLPGASAFTLSLQVADAARNPTVFARNWGERHCSRRGTFIAIACACLSLRPCTPLVGATAIAKDICTTGTNLTDCGAARISLASTTDNQIYLISMPVDPSCPTGCAASSTGYRIATTTNGRVVVSAPNAELGVTVSMTR